jgi:hypothetical protein
MTKRAGQITLANTRGPRDEDIVVRTDPLACRERRYQRSIQATARLQVKILDGRLLPQTGTPEPCRQGPVLLFKAFPVDKKTEALLKHQSIPLRILLLFLQGPHHAKEAQGFQRFNCWM